MKDSRFLEFTTNDDPRIPAHLRRCFVHKDTREVYFPDSLFLEANQINLFEEHDILGIAKPGCSYLPSAWLCKVAPDKAEQITQMAKAVLLVAHPSSPLN